MEKHKDDTGKIWERHNSRNPRILKFNDLVIFLIERKAEVIFLKALFMSDCSISTALCSPPGSSVPWSFPGKNTGSNRCLFHLLHWQVDSLPLVPPEKPQNHLGQVLKTTHAGFPS